MKIIELICCICILTILYSVSLPVFAKINLVKAKIDWIYVYHNGRLNKAMTENINSFDVNGGLDAKDPFRIGYIVSR